MFYYARTSETGKLAEYWDQLPLSIITTPLMNVPELMTLIGEGYKATLATYLTQRIQAMSLCDADAAAYIEEGITNSDSHLRRCQQILLWSQYCNKIKTEVNDLIPSIGYFTDARRDYTAPIREYGVTISKV
jgi:hypothetical protein